MRTYRCIDCGGESVTDKPTGLPPQRCAECKAIRSKTYNAERQKAWRAANPERARAHWNKSNRKRLADPEHLRQKNEAHMLRKYDLTMAEFDALLAKQGGVCAICGGGRNGPGARFHVDHCHKSAKVRGLLCGRCNTAIGLLQDDPKIAESAAAYLRR